MLIVEDEPNLRDLFAQMIKGLGYRVATAENGETALFAVEKEQLRPDILITDVVMPGMNGKTLAERLTRLHADLKILFISGYTENSIVHHGVLDANLAFLQKPFNKN